MSEPYWSALGARAGAGGVDYKGAWQGLTPYLQGDVVRHGGVDYLAVNPSTGVDPGVATGLVLPVGIGTSLPGSPTDGQEYVLVDSLTAPTYAWRFRYVASITDAYKWVFVGGYPIQTSVEAINVYWASGTYTGTLGSLAVLPRAGIWDLEHASICKSNGGGEHYYRFGDSANVAIPGARVHYQNTQSGNQWWLTQYRERLTIAAPASIGIQISNQGQGGDYTNRENRAWPVRVA